MDSKIFPHTDEQILRWEQQRGTMPSHDKLGTEWLADDEQKLPYSPPAIIHEGELTTRAGSLIPGSGLDYDVDAVKLFGEVR